MAVEIEGGAAFRPSAPHELFRTNFRIANREYRSYAPIGNGQQFVIDMIKERASTLLTVVTASPSSFAAAVKR